MATYFSINNGNFTDAGVFGRTLSAGDVNSGTTGFLLTTTHTYCPVVSSDGSSYTGIGLHLSARSATPTGTLDMQLSASNGSITNISYPVSSFTGYDGSNNGTSSYPQNWQLVSFVVPVSIPNREKMVVGVKTSNLNQVSLIGTSSNFDKYIVTTSSGTPAAGDSVHISSSLSRTDTTPYTVTYNSPSTGYLRDMFIHNGGTLAFSNSTSTTLGVSGSNGLQVTSQGTLSIGTQASPIPSNISHTVNLNGASVNVHTGGNFNVNGINKAQYAYLASDTTATTRVFSTVNTITNWVAGDTVIISPSANATVSSFDVLSLSAVDNNNTFRTTAAPSYLHSSIYYVPTVMNMTRNVKFRGVGTSGFIRFTDAAQVSINNAEFANIANSSQMFTVATNPLASVLLSSCAVSGNAANIPAFKLGTGKTTFFNISSIDSNFYNLGSTDMITFNATSASNVSMNGNICMKSSQNGISLISLSATNSTFSNNWGIGCTQNGFYVKDPLFSNGSIGGFGYRNTGVGTAVVGTSAVGAFNGIGGFYNFREGCNISGNISNLGSVTFSNISASNNTTAGVAISGNSQVLTSPVTLNINGVVANDNGGAGFEGYSITGNLSSMTLNNNYAYGIKTSIGNAATVFDGVSSEGTIVSGITLTKVGTPTLSTASPFGVGTDSSVKFNGTSDYLRTSKVVFGTNNFTVETWAYITSSTAQQQIIGQWSGAINAGTLSWIIVTSNDANRFLRFLVSTNGSTVLFDQVTTTSLPLNTWSHIALTRDTGGVYRIFLNGVLCGNGTITNTSALFNASNDITIGASSNSTQFFNGYLSNVRIVNGTALYTQNFNTSAPISPLTPLTLTSNTVFLYNDPYGNFAKDTYSGTCAFGILSAQNYFPTVIKSAKLITSTNSTNNGSAILLDSSKFEQFTVESSTLSSYQDVKTLANRNYVEGSYQFNNCTFNNGILSSTLTNYQPEIFLETGFAAMRVGGVSTNHFRWTPSGKISSDTVRYYGTNLISEKLEPISATKKLRCGSKLIPVNSGDTHTVSVYVYSTGPTPRLMLKKNASLGYSDTVLATTGTTGSWVLLTGSIPAAASAGIFEVYVDCSGTSGSVNVDNWTLI